jgi:hypothetical protein
MFWLTGVIFLFVTLIEVIYLIRSLSGGDAIFDMSDVNLLFVSPINSRKVLLYGIVRMAKMALIASFFILFQTSTLAGFGVDYSGVLITCAGFFLSVIAMTIISLLIYSITNGNPRRKRVVKCLIVLMFLPLVIYLLTQILATGEALPAVEAAIGSPFLKFVPIAGWTASGITAILSGKVVSGLIFLSLNLLLCAAATVYILLSNPDYYEDVLVATETAYEKKRAAAEGNIGAVTTFNGKVSVSRTGISGLGASAIFGKHMRENFRENRFGLLNLYSVFLIAGAVILLAVVKDMLITTQTLLWVQIFFIGTGRGLKETYSHYIYLIPESSFKKILWSNVEIMIRILLEGTLIFGIGGIIIRASAPLILLCILVYALCSVLIHRVNYEFMRFLGANISAGVLIFIYFIAVLIIMVPGVIPSIIVGTLIGGNAGLYIGMLMLSGWELAAGLGCFALSRGVLHNCDMAQIKLNR